MPYGSYCLCSGVVDTGIVNSNFATEVIEKLESAFWEGEVGCGSCDSLNLHKRFHLRNNL